MLIILINEISDKGLKILLLLNSVNRLRPQKISDSAYVEMTFEFIGILASHIYDIQYPVQKGDLGF